MKNLLLLLFVMLLIPGRISAQPIHEKEILANLTNLMKKPIDIDFDVPNDDIFFEELKPRKVK